MSRFLFVFGMLFSLIFGAQCFAQMVSECEVCRKDNVRVVLVDGSKKYCDNCARRYACVCSCCKNWVGKANGVELQTSFHVCERCLDKDFQDRNYILALYDRVRLIIERDMGFTDRFAPQLNWSQLNPDPENIQLYGLYKTRTSAADISPSITIEKNQKFLKIIGTIAHEYGHSLHYKINPRLFKTRALKEGFAVWMSWRFYLIIGQGDFFATEIYPELWGPYAQGFDLMSKLENKGGMQAVMYLITRWDDHDEAGEWNDKVLKDLGL